MTRRIKKTRQIQGRSNKQFTTDSYQNFAARVGMGTDNLASEGRYGFSFISRDRNQLEAAYRESWICGQAVDVVAEDMTKMGIELTVSDPAKHKRYESEIDRYNVWGALTETIKWSRLYGGAIAVILIDGQKPETELDINTITKGSFRGLLPLDRWLANPSLSDLVTEYGRDYGKPKYYDVTKDAMALQGMRIHHSRVIRMEGVELPYWQRIAENGWGQSVLERLWSRLLAFDSATEGVSQLIYKAHLRTVGIKDLRKVLAEGGEMLDALKKEFAMLRLFQSNEHITLLDASDIFNTHSYSFAGLPDALLQLAMQISGATGIPLVRLFGQSPTGLNATGESDMENYYGGILQLDERVLRPGLNKVIPIAYMSANGVPIDEDFGFTFRPLKLMSDEAKADIASKASDTIGKVFDAQIIDRSTALKELKQTGEKVGFWTNITDEMIQQAEREESFAPPKPQLANETNTESKQDRPGREVLQ